MTAMLGQLFAPIVVIAIVLFIYWGFLTMMYWLSNIIWDAVYHSTNEFKVIRYDPKNLDSR